MRVGIIGCLKRPSVPVGETGAAFLVAAWRMHETNPDPITARPRLLMPMVSGAGLPGQPDHRSPSFSMRYRKASRVNPKSLAAWV